jgi:hypothetical protein
MNISGNSRNFDRFLYEKSLLISQKLIEEILQCIDAWYDCYSSCHHVLDCGLFRHNYVECKLIDSAYNNAEYRNFIISIHVEYFLQRTNTIHGPHGNADARFEYQIQSSSQQNCIRSCGNRHWHHDNHHAAVPHLAVQMYYIPWYISNLHAALHEREEKEDGSKAEISILRKFRPFF